MRIYVTNPTRVDMEFMYRISEMPQPRRGIVPAASQQMLPDDLSPSAVAEVVEQLERYGGVPHTDVNAIVYPNSMLYRIGKPIDEDTGTAAHEKDMDMRIERSVDMTEKTGTTLYGSMQHAAEQSGVDPNKLHKTTMTIEETSDSPGGVDGITTTITVDKGARTKGLEREGGKPVKRSKST